MAAERWLLLLACGLNENTFAAWVGDGFTDP